MRLQRDKKLKSKMRRGPKPELLKLNGNWKQAIAFSFQKKRPKDGWPKPAG
jgi:hypothetical protein